MDATPSLHATWRTSRTRRLITGAGITAALAASVLLPVPARAITTETAATLTETQKKVEETAAAFDEANKNLEELQAKITDNEARIAELEEKLPDAQAKASRAMREMYKHSKGSNPLMSFVLNTQSLDEFISRHEVPGSGQGRQHRGPARKLNDMQAELEAEKTKLSTAKAQAETEKQSAEEALSEAQSLREAAQAKADAEAAAELAALQQAAAEAAQNEAGSNTSPGNVTTPDNGAVSWDTDQASFIAEWAPASTRILPDRRSKARERRLPTPRGSMASTRASPLPSPTRKAPRGVTASFPTTLGVGAAPAGAAGRRPLMRMSPASPVGTATRSASRVPRSTARPIGSTGTTTRFPR